LVLREKRAHREIKDQLVRLVHKENKVLLVLKALPEPKDQQVHREIRD